MGDPQRYRTKEEVEERKKNDPIHRFEQELLARKLANDSDFEKLRAGVEKITAGAVEFAETSPAPDPAELYSDVFAEPIE